jgi:hypothetical protein
VLEYDRFEMGCDMEIGSRREKGFVLLCFFGRRIGGGYFIL